MEEFLTEFGLTMEDFPLNEGVISDTEKRKKALRKRRGSHSWETQRKKTQTPSRSNIAIIGFLS